MSRAPFTQLPITLALAVLLPLLALAGCTFEAAVKPPPAPADAVERQLPLAMGVYYPPEFLGYSHRQSYGAGPHDLTFAVGETSATHFSRVFDVYFQQALRFHQYPSATRPAGGVDAVLVPGIQRVDMTDPALFGYAGSWKTRLVYRFRMLDTTGLPIASWIVEGHGADGGFDWVGMAIPRKAFNLALADAGRNFITGFTREAQVKSWLIARGVQVSRDRAPPYGPVFEAKAAAPVAGQGKRAPDYLWPGFGQSGALRIAAAVRRINPGHRSGLRGIQVSRRHDRADGPPPVGSKTDNIGREG